jgi:hypothetical protein
VHDTIRGINDAFTRRDIAAVAFLGDDYEFHPEADSPLAVHRYRGREGMRRYFEHAYEVWEEIGLRIERLVDADEQVLAPYDLEVGARGSGIVPSERWAEVWEAPAGELVSSYLYTSHEEALAAAGLQYRHRTLVQTLKLWLTLADANV